MLITKLIQTKKPFTACARNEWQCDYGDCISLTKKCDGTIDCPDDMSDERNCPSNSK